MNLVLVGKPYSNPWKNYWSNLDGLGFFPESLLYRWDAASMTENRVIKIVAAPPEAGKPWRNRCGIVARCGPQG